MKYDPKASTMLRFHEAIAGFLNGNDTPRAYLERCLETIEALEPTVSAWVHQDPGIARAASDAATKR